MARERLTPCRNPTTSQPAVGQPPLALPALWPAFGAVHTLFSVAAHGRRLPPEKTPRVSAHGVYLPPPYERKLGAPRGTFTRRNPDQAPRPPRPQGMAYLAWGKSRLHCDRMVNDLSGDRARPGRGLRPPVWPPGTGRRARRRPCRRYGRCGLTVPDAATTGPARRRKCRFAGNRYQKPSTRAMPLYGGCSRSVQWFSRRFGACFRGFAKGAYRAFGDQEAGDIGAPGAPTRKPWSSFATARPASTRRGT